MHYDFETTIDRTQLSSIKWRMMRQKRPQVSAGIVPFSTADMEFVNAPEIIEGLKRSLDTGVLGYPDPQDGAYLQAVCGWMERRHGWHIEADWICGTPGVVDAFFWAIQAFSEPGDGIIVQTPVYYPFYGAIEQNGRRTIRNPLVRAGSSYVMDFEDLEAKASDPGARILLFCSPHNPVGRVWTREELERVGEICLRHDLIIISDEIHFDLVMPGFRHSVFATISEDVARRMIVCTAPSKTFNLAGMKTSNIIIPDEEIRKRFLARSQANGYYSSGLLGYEACRLAYTHCEAWLDEAIGVIQRNHFVVKEFMGSRLPGIGVCDLEGTYLQWMDFRSLGMEREELEGFLHDEAELFFDAGRVFGPEGEGFQRMNLACPTRLVIAGLERLEKALRRRGLA